MNKRNVFEGDLTTEAGKVYEYTEITGSLYINTDAKFDALTSVGGNLHISADAKLDALTSVGGNLHISADAKLDALTSVGGYLYIRAGAKLDALTSVGGNLQISADAKLDALTSVGGYLQISADAKFDALTIVGGNIDINADAKLDALTSVGGSLYISADAKLDALTSVGGSLYINADAKLDAPNAKKADHTAGAKCSAMLLSSFAAAGFSFADRILARIVSTRGPVSRVIICGKTEISYVVSDDEGNYAHGDTLAEARSDLAVKRVSKDLTQFKSWKLDKTVSKGDAILAYRAITGACAKGTRLWLEQRQTPEKITVKEIISLTKGAYGAERFAGFFKVVA